MSPAETGPVASPRAAISHGIWVEVALYRAYGISEGISSEAVDLAHGLEPAPAWAVLAARAAYHGGLDSLGLRRLDDSPAPLGEGRVPPSFLEPFSLEASDKGRAWGRPPEARQFARPHIDTVHLGRDS